MEADRLPVSECVINIGITTSDAVFSERSTEILLDLQHFKSKIIHLDDLQQKAFFNQSLNLLPNHLSPFSCRGDPQFP